MATRKNINLLENTLRRVISEEAKADGIRQEIEDAYKAVKEVKRKMVDELEDLEDMDMEETEVSEEDEETIKKNEQSEGYGTWQGLGLNERVVKITESDMGKLLRSAVGKKNSKLRTEINHTLGLIRNAIIKEGIGHSLNISLSEH